MQMFKLLFTTPLMWVFYLLVGAVVFLRSVRKDPQMRRGWYLLVTSIIFLYFLSCMPVATSLSYFIQKSYEQPSEETLKELNFVVVLGGGISRGFNEKAEPSSATYTRVVRGVEVFQKSSPATILVLSGGPDEEGSESEASVMSRIAERYGISENQMLLEIKSHNTEEEVLELKQILPGNYSRNIGLVTSALHMPRALLIFQKQFPSDHVIPISADTIFRPQFLGIQSFIPSADALSMSTAVFHEWIGIAWYKMRE